MGRAQLICPICQASNVRRSRRRSIVDHLLGVTGLLPWRCESCETRFRARHMPWRALYYAHCGICGNLELQRISGEHVPGMGAMIGRMLRIPALRCGPCRYKFFSVRPLLRERERMAVTPGH